MVAQGDIWLMAPNNGKRRPVLIVSRDSSIPVLTNVVVAPITSTLRAIPTNITVGADEGIDHESVATFDNLSTIPKSALVHRLGDLGPLGFHRICTALSALADC